MIDRAAFAEVIRMLRIYRPSPSFEDLADRVGLDDEERQVAMRLFHSSPMSMVEAIAAVAERRQLRLMPLGVVEVYPETIRRMANAVARGGI